MTEIINPKRLGGSSSESIIHQFRSLNPDQRNPSEPVKIEESKEKVYKKTETELTQQDTGAKIEKSIIFGSAFMLTNLCLDTTIFTFAVRTKLLD